MTTTSTPADNGPKTFTLTRPFEFRGSRFETMTLREPKVRDLRMFLKAVEADAILAMERTLAALCNVDDPVIAEMSIADFGKLKRWFESFLLAMTEDSRE